MACGKLVVLMALCLLGTGARAVDTGVASTATATSLLSGMMPQGGMVASVKSALAASMAPISASVDQLHAALNTKYAAVAEELETVVAAAEAQYCTPASFSPSVKVPASFTGSSMSVTFSLGGCSFNRTQWMEDGQKVLNCTEPSIFYSKNPANFTSKYHKAPAFKSKECKVPGKTFGESVEKVLFVFDGTQAPDMNSLIAKITEEVKGVLGTVGNGAQDVFNSVKSGMAGLLS